MISRIKAAVTRREPSILEDIIGVISLFAILFIGLSMPAAV